MPVSDWRNVPAVMKAVLECGPVQEWEDWPLRILDVGCGFGKYGTLFREQFDIFHQRYEKPSWLSVIDGVEIWERWITPLHRYIYDNVFIEDIAKTVCEHSDYDIVYIGDVIEHFDKEVGEFIIKESLARNMNVILSIPDGANKLVATNGTMGGCADYLDNPHEVHKALWFREDFPEGKFYDTNYDSACFVVKLQNQGRFQEGQKAFKVATSSAVDLAS